MKYSFKINFFSGFVIISFIISFLPFLVSSFYAEPAGDDYSYAVKMLDKSFWEIQLGEYMNWGSRYTATSILILNPISYGWFTGYKIISFLMIVSFIQASFYFFKTFIADNKLTIVLSSSFIFCYLFLLPHVTSAFYWLAGSATYHFANVLTLLFVSVFYKSNYSNKIRYKILSFILIFLIIGCNEVSMVFLDVFLFIIIVYKYVKNKKISHFHLGLIIFAAILTLFILLAPGNKARVESIEPHNLSLISMILMTLRKVFAIIIRYGIITFIISFFVFLNLKIHLKTIQFCFLKLPTYFYVVLMLFFLFLGIFPSIFSLGNYPPARTVNSLFLVLLVFIFIINYKIMMFYDFGNKFAGFASVIVISSVVLSYIFIIRDRNISELSNNLYFVYKELLDDTIANYSQEETQRRNKIKNSKEEVVYVDRIKNKSVILTYSDLQKPHYFYNVAVAKFYGKKEIAVNGKE